MPYNLALVTGASRGIGRAIALALAGEKLEIVATARNGERLRGVVQDIKKQGGQGSYIEADLNHPEDLQHLTDQLHHMNAPLELLIHCAGIADVDPTADFSPARWQEIIEINLTVPFLLTQKCLPLMSKGSQIIFINSVAGKNAFPDWSAYCAAKAGLKAYADVLRLEVQTRGIRVTSIFPSSVDTAMHDRLPYDWDRKKMLQVENVAQAVVYCYRQPANVVIKEIELENSAGVF